jgi:nitrate reductase molybdenum cofactor assembly chaperone NarJ/NarW
MRRKRLVYTLISSLLKYPNEEWKDIDETWKNALRITEDSVRIPLVKFLTYIKETAYEELCENYVNTFDFFEKNKVGLELISEERPDYLPLILEFAEIAPEDQVENILRRHKRSIDTLQLELQGINSPYRFLITACMENMVQSDEEENEKVS